MDRKRKRCGGSIERMMPSATLCWECSNTPTRIAPEGVKRAGKFNRIVIDGKVFCVDCKEEIVLPYKSRGGVPMRCGRCATIRKADDAMQAAAHTAVAKAIRHGHIKRPSEFECDDCGKPAECYDHRSYSKPLDVVPVCRSCNVIRGSADDSRKAA